MVDDSLQDRVRLVIAESGLSHQAFSLELGIDPTKLSKSLSGARRFTTYELAAVAERGHTTVDWLLSGTAPESARIAARVASTAPAADSLRRARDRARDLAEVDEALTKLTGPRSLPELPGLTETGGPVAQGEQLGTAARKLLDAKPYAAEFASAPEEVLERAFGVDVACERLGPGADGLAWSTSGFRLILVNADSASWSRRRFTLAHELGHIMAGGAGADHGLRLDENVMGSNQSPDEVRANAFAAAFLMPAAAVRRAVADADSGDGPHDVPEPVFGRLVGDFRVSPSAMAWRLLNLRLIDKARRAELCAMAPARAAEIGGWSEHYAKLGLNLGRRRCPTPLALRSLRAYLDGTLGARVLGKALGMDPEAIRDYFSQAQEAETSRPDQGDPAACGEEQRVVFVP